MQAEIRTGRRAALGLLWLAAPAWAASLPAQNWLALRLPPRTQAEWVIQHGRVNGFPAQIQQLQSELSADDLLAFFRREWQQRGGSPKAGQVGGWRTLSLQEDPYQAVLQLQEGGPRGSRALLSQMNLRQRSALGLPAELPAMPSLRLQQLTESWDGAKRSRLFQFASSSSSALTQQQLRNHWLRQGWRLLYEQQQGRGDQWLAAFERGSSSVDVVLANDPTSGTPRLTLNFLDTDS